MRSGTEFVINLAPTGAMTSRATSPHVPVTVEQIVADAEEALALGVQMLHLHARDAEGNQTGDPGLFREIVTGIRALPLGREAVLCVSTSGRFDPDYEARSPVLFLDGEARPDMASLTLSSLNFLQSASINAPQTIRRLAATMRDNGIRPELEIFDLGMVNFVHVLLKEKLIEPPLYANVLLGNIAGAQADPLQFAATLAQLPAGTMVGIAGLGRQQLSANLMGLLFADAVRTGLEDNAWLDHGRRLPARNADLVARVLRLAAELERPLMSRTALRQRLNLS